MFDFYKKLLENYILNITYSGIPEILQKAMRYSLELPGKRLRGVLLLASYAMLGKEINQALPFAAAIEMIHTYSLIHDDLPSMDNDDLRRGKPSNHKVFGEGMAILAGDSLLNYAHEIMLDFCVKNKQFHFLKAAHVISKYAGASGMIAGQAIDISTTTDTKDAETLRYIHQHKTADMIIASVMGGLFIAEANDKQLNAGKEYAYHLGCAFQIIDDILDATGESEIIGKSIGKDCMQNKLTWVSMFGVKQARLAAEMHTKQACSAILGAFANGEFLIEIAKKFLDRLR